MGLGHDFKLLNKYKVFLCRPLLRRPSGPPLSPTLCRYTGTYPFEPNSLPLAHIHTQIRAALGGRLKLAISGAAPLSAQTEEFMRVGDRTCAGRGEEGEGGCEMQTEEFMRVGDRMRSEVVPHSP